MSLGYGFDGTTLVFTTEGDVDYERGTQVLRDGFAAIAAREAKFDLLFDIRRSTESRESEEVREIARLIAEHERQLTGYVAVIATDQLRYGVSRQFQIFLEGLGLECRIFEEPGAAVEWLQSMRNG